MRQLKPLALTLVSLAVIIGLTFVSSAYARDARHKYNIQEALDRALEEGILNDGVKLYFGDQNHPSVSRTIGQFKTNKKTNAFNKSDQEACEWAFFTALITLQHRAAQEGGDAVINIKSNYKNREFSSTTEFECGAGNIIAGVALKGTVVQFE